MRAYQGSILYIGDHALSQFRADDVVILKGVHPNVISGALALDFDDEFEIKRFDDDVKPTWDEVLEWYARMNEEWSAARERKRQRRTIS